ncbi:MAG TPA: nucleotidyltransferase domain-containing protein [Candidatus Obscuribacterales bacterium]
MTFALHIMVTLGFSNSGRHSDDLEPTMTIFDTRTTASDPLLQDLVRRLVDAYHPERIYLFGSRARGSARLESDYDFLVVVSNNSPDELKSAGKAYEALWGVTVPVDVVVWTQEEFDKRLHIRTSLPAEVSREGMLVHVA